MSYPEDVRIADERVRTISTMESISIARLRERAERCRTSAREAQSNGIAVELEKLAHDYEQDANRLEASTPRHRQA